MPFPPVLARSFAQSMLPAEQFERFQRLHFDDAGHGFDAFGMHADFVALGAGITAPLYDRYFRIESFGHEHIPRTGCGILAANHSGTIPIDGMMIWSDVLRHTDPPRVVRAVADHFVPALPWIGTLFARSGVVGGSRGNVRSLLESGQLLMIFPEGTPAIVKPHSEAYKLHRFRVGHAELAIRYQAPVVPVAVVGAEELVPHLANSRRLGRLVGLPRLPIPAAPPLPVKIRIYYGEPIPVPDRYKPHQADDPAAVREAAEAVQASVQALIDRGLRERKGLFQ